VTNGFDSSFPSQYSRLVREALCELELPYVLHNIGEGSTRMKSLLNASGSNKVHFLVRSLSISESTILQITYQKAATADAQYNLQVPFLVDPNTGVQLGDYEKILAYLFKTYSSAAFA